MTLIVSVSVYLNGNGVSLQVSAADLEKKNQELSRAVEELSKLVKDTGEGTILYEYRHVKIKRFIFSIIPVLI